MAETKGMIIELGVDVTKFNTAIEKVQGSLKRTESELKLVERSLKFNPGNVKLLKQKFDLLKRSVSDNEAKLKQLQAKQKEFDARNVDKNTEEYRRLEREIVKTQNQIDRAKKKLREMGSVKLTALGTKLKNIGKSMRQVGSTLTMRVTAPLAAAGAVSVKKFAEVDKTMQLTTSTMGATADEADLLNKAMKDAAASSTFGMNDAATAALNFARAGLSAEQAAEALAPAMALAAGEGGELDIVSGGLVATINGFHGEFSEASKYADVFANACNNSALDVNSLSTAMSIAAPIFASAGYGVEDAALYMGIMANNGIEANKAANSLKTGMARLVSPAKEGAEMMDALGISVTNSDGTMKDSVQIQKELHDAFSKLSESEQIAAASAIFGKNQMSPWLALINTAPGDVDTLNASIGQTGTAMQMQADMMSGFGGSLEKLKSGVDVLATSLGEALAPMVLKVANGIQMLVDWFNGLSPRMQQVVAIIGVVVAAVGPVLVILGALLGSVGAIATGISTLIGFAGVVGPALAGAFAVITGPIGLAVAAIAGAIAIGVLLYKNWDKVKAILQKTLNAIKNAFSRVFNSIKQKVTNIMTTIKSTVSRIVNGIKSTVTSVFSSMKAKVSSIFDGMKDAISKKINAAKTTITGLVNKVKGMFSGIKISFPHVPVPHFSIDPPGWKLGDLVKGKIPKLSVQMHKNAMQSGRILKGATIFGAMGDKLLGGGEVGREVVTGANSLSGLVTYAVARGLNMAAGTLAQAVGTQNALAGGGNAAPIVVDVYLYKNGPQMGRYIVDTYDTWKAKLG